MEPDSESSMLDKGQDAPEAWHRKHAFEEGLFPAEQKPASHRMLGMECSCLKASFLHREPGLSWSGHPATPSKDGQCRPAGPFCSAHFPPALLSIAFPSAQLSTSPGPSPTPRPAQTISPSRKEAGVQVTCSPRLLPNRALPALLPGLGTEPSLCPPSLICIGPAHTQ